MSTNRDRIGCYMFTEYDHFIKDCPTSKEEREETLATDMYDSLDKLNSLGNITLA